MKLITFILFLACFSVTASSYSQGAKLSLNYSNITYQELFEKIESQSEFRFVYSNSKIDLNKKVEVNANDVDLTVILDKVLPEKVSYEIVDNYVVITDAKQTATATPTVSKATQQKKTVSGTVTDESGEPVPGVSVIIVGTTTGSITDMDGKYSLQIPTDATVLQFSFVGMKTQEVKVEGKTKIDVVLAADVVGIEEVVAVGYGTVKKSDLTGAIVSVKADDLENRSTTNVATSLQGKTAGLTFVNTAGSAPGATPTIHIRGFASNYSSNPLYVVDGLRMSDISYLDPNDVESIEILKDAASAAIYGQEAGNGVILVTTRKGKKGDAKITYDFQMTFDNLARVPDVMNSEQYLTYLKEAGVYTDATYNNLISSGAWDGKSTTDWSKVAFETGLTQRHNISFLGGGPEGSFYLSASYLENDGMAVSDNDYYRRISATLNMDRNLKSWVKVGTNNNFGIYNSRSVTSTGTSTYSSLFAGVINLDPTLSPIYPADALPTHMQKILDSGDYTLMGDERGYYGWSALQTIEQYNPLISTNTGHADNSSFNLRGSTYLDFKPIKDLVITSRLAYNFGSSNNYSYGYEYYANTNSFVNQHNVSRNGSYSIFYEWENYFNYSKQINAHNINVTGGMSYQQNRNRYVSGSVTDVQEDDWYMWGSLSNKTTEATVSASDSDSESRRISYYGRFNYSYADKYLFSGVVRADAADLAYLPMANRWGYFPSLSAGWIISKENFFPVNDKVTFLKLRTSWGQNGSLGSLGGYAYSSSMNYATFGYAFDVSGYGTTPTYQRSAYPSNIVNDELSWETSEAIDIALDARFLNDRLTFTADWFNKKTKDLIVSGTTLPVGTGNSAPPINAGNVTNSGIEMELGWKEQKGDFSYSIRANMSTLKNEVTYMDPSITRLSGSSWATFGTITAFEVGHPVWYFYGYEYAGVDMESGDPLFYNAEGDVVFGDELDEEIDKTEIGKGLPDVTYGVTINLNYKAFDFTMFGSGAYGNDIFSCLGYSVYHNKLVDYYNERWVAGADNSNATRPRADTNNLDKYSTSTAFVYDGAYFKIKQIQFGYTLPKRLTRVLHVDKLRLYASMDDWFTFTSYPGLDPEAASNSYSGMGIDFGSYPNARKTLFGASITF